MMRLPKIDYHAPNTVREACFLLDKYGEEAKIMAGGTDLLVACKLRNIKPSRVVSLIGIQELKGISFQEEDLRIGATTSLYDIRSHSFISNHYPALAQAAAAVGTVQIQYMGTVGGNLCLDTRCIYYNQSESWRKSRAVCLKMGGDVCHVISKGKRCSAVFSGDIAPVLLALDARVRLISSAGDRKVPLGELFTGDGRKPIAVKSDEVLTEVRIPRLGGEQSSTYLKFRSRGSIDFPLAGVAVRMDSKEKGVCTDCKVVLTAVSPAPIEISEARELLRGRSLSVEFITQAAKKAWQAAHPVANTLGSTPTYRRKMVEILTERALVAVANRLNLI
jgi:4-hydroxybenzoyl-CoA reductase subunit beta